jgi:hypothetical protein
VPGKLIAVIQIHSLPIEGRLANRGARSRITPKRALRISSFLFSTCVAQRTDVAVCPTDDVAIAAGVHVLEVDSAKTNFSLGAPDSKPPSIAFELVALRSQFNRGKRYFDFALPHITFPGFKVGTRLLKRFRCNQRTLTCFAKRYE